MNELFNRNNNLDEIINYLKELINENKFQIIEFKDNNNINFVLKLSIDIIFNLIRIKNDEIIDLLIEEIKNLKSEIKLMRDENSKCMKKFEIEWKFKKMKDNY